MPGIGESAGVAASALWAIASLLYVRLPWNAWILTTAKNAVATCLLCGLVMGLWLLWGRSLAMVSTYQLAVLSLSACIGLAMGDTAYFRSLQILGPRQALTLTLLTPPTTACLGAVFLHEQLPSSIWVAMIMIVSGNGLAIWEGRRGPARDANVQSSWNVHGVLFGLLAVAGQAIGGILIKMGSQSISSLEATVIRLATATCCGFLLGAVWDRRGWTEFFRLANRKTLWRLVIASFCGTVLGIWFMMVAFQRTPVGVAATLTSLSPLFVLPLVAWILREPIGWRGWLGGFLAAGGVYWLFFAERHLGHI